MAIPIYEDGPPDQSEYLGYPRLLFEVDGAIDETALIDANAGPGYGRTLAFDWTGEDGPRLRVQNGNPVVIQGPAALLDSIIKTLLTARFTYPVYTDDYGSELEFVLGRPRNLVETLIPSMIRDALLEDDRIRAVEDIVVQPASGSVIHVTFAVTDFTGERLRLPPFVVRYA